MNNEPFTRIPFEPDPKRRIECCGCGIQAVIYLASTGGFWCAGCKRLLDKGKTPYESKHDWKKRKVAAYGITG